MIEGIQDEHLMALSSIPAALESNQVLSHLTFQAANGSPLLDFHDALSTALSVNKRLQLLEHIFPVESVHEGAFAALVPGVASSSSLRFLVMISQVDEDNTDLMELTARPHGSTKI
jgi:hypothetical protein